MCKIYSDNNQINDISYDNIINKKNDNEDFMEKVTKEYKTLNGEIEEITAKKRNIENIGINYIRKISYHNLLSYFFYIK